MKGFLFAALLVAELQPGFTFAGSVAAKSTQPEAAKALIQFLAAPSTKDSKVKAGLQPPPGQ